jgi:UDP-N-acetylmuramoylalanine--D-glutamate ligase
MDGLNIKYLVFGAARSGIAAAKLLRSHGEIVSLFDEKDLQELKDTFSLLENDGIKCIPGGINYDDLLLGIDILVLSPGVPLTHPLVRKAEEKKLEITGELELASRYIKGRISCVSGTNGKSTTVSIIALILNAASIVSKAVGNVGYSLSAAVLDPGLNREDGCMVIEASSYQLETINTFHPDVAVLLNLTPDHLKRHGCMENYRDCKFRITENQGPQDFLILNSDDEWIMPLAEKTKAQILTFSLKGPVKKGAWLDKDALWLSMDKKIPLMKRSEIPIPGIHNVQNVLAAALVCIALGVNKEDIADAVRSFPGVEHRIEFVLTKDNVDFYNDSKATNLDSMEKALESFTRPIILIAGGTDKGDDYKKLNSLISDKVKHLVLMGEAAPLIHEAWGNLVSEEFAGDMKESVSKAFAASSPGDIVLLSPGCSSFDAFRDFEDRGEVFKSIVKDMYSRRI